MFEDFKETEGFREKRKWGVGKCLTTWAGRIVLFDLQEWWAT